MASKERDAIKRKCLAADFLRDLFDNKDVDDLCVNETR